MRLDAIQYSEFRGTERAWEIEPATFEEITLIVGRNASGKSRFLNIIYALARLLRGDQKELFTNGIWVASISSAEHRYIYELEIGNRQVTKESLTRGQERLL